MSVRWSLMAIKAFGYSDAINVATANRRIRHCYVGNVTMKPLKKHWSFVDGSKS